MIQRKEGRKITGKARTREQREKKSRSRDGGGGGATVCSTRASAFRGLSCGKYGNAFIAARCTHCRARGYRSGINRVYGERARTSLYEPRVFINRIYFPRINALTRV